MILNRYIFFILAFTIFIAGCIEEPTIEKAPTPFSTLKLGNFSDNLSSITITVDGEQSYTLSQGSFSSDFNITSGQRNFVVTDANNSEVFNADLTITSYEEIYLLFTGYSQPGDEFNNSFSNFNYTDGYVYLLEDGDNDSIAVKVFNLISATPDQNSINMLFTVNGVNSGSSEETEETFAFNEVSSLFVDQGKKEIILVNSAEDGLDTMKTIVTENDLEPGFGHFFFVTGPLDDPTVVYEKRTPLEVQSKYN